jgi:hypothetical protein
VIRNKRDVKRKKKKGRRSKVARTPSGDGLALSPAGVCSSHTCAREIVCFLPVLHEPALLGEPDKADCMSTFSKLGVQPHMLNRFRALSDN